MNNNHVNTIESIPNDSIVQNNKVYIPFNETNSDIPENSII